MKRFVVLLNTVTEAQNESFKKFITDSGLGYWHWLPNTWLLYTGDDDTDLSAVSLRDKIGEFYPHVRCLVLEFNKDGDNWSGYGPKGDKKNMFTWLHQNWTRKDGPLS
jgi:hypothetical protein